MCLCLSEIVSFGDLQGFSRDQSQNDHQPWEHRTQAKSG